MEISMAAPLFLLAGTAIRAATPMILKALKKVGAKQIKKPTESQIKISKKPLPEKLKKDLLEKSRKKEAKEIVDRGVRKNKNTEKQPQPKKTKEDQILNEKKRTSEFGKLNYNKGKLRKENPKEYEKLYGEEAYKKGLAQKKFRKEMDREAKLSVRRSEYNKNKTKDIKTDRELDTLKYGMKSGGFTKRGPHK